MNRLGILVALLLLATAAPALAQVSPYVSYQGVLTDNTGALVPDGAYDVTFRLYNSDVGGGALWTEAHTGANAVPVLKGGFSVLLGTITGFTVVFDAPYWLEIEVAGGGGPLTPRVRLTSSPYAFMAKTVVNNGITSAKVLDGTLVGADIAAGAIGQTQIATGGVGSTEVADNSLTGTDLLDEPGVAFLEGETTDILTSTPIALAGRSITVPAAGYVVATANAELSIGHVNGTMDDVFLSISTASGTHDTGNQRELRLTNLLTDTGTYRLESHVQAVFSVTAGAHSFYLVGSATSGSGVNSPAHSLMLLYVPTSYGGVTLAGDTHARPPGGADPDRP